MSAEQLDGRVMQASGAAPASVGDACSVRIAAAYFPVNGRVRVDCGGRRLYGMSGFSGDLACETTALHATSCRDHYPIAPDGDPQLVLDRRRGHLALRDGSSWRVVFALDEPR